MNLLLINLKNKFKDFKISTLIIEGKDDLVWKKGKTKKLFKNHPHSQLEIIKQARHYPFRDNPRVFFKVLKKFLIKVS